MRVVQITTDNREVFVDRRNPVPWFGTAPEALLQGFARLEETEVHVLGCTQERMTSPEKLAENIWFHSLYVPKRGWLRSGYQGCIRAVRKKVREIAPDIVHGQGTERECAMSAVFSGRPNVLTIHGNMAELARLFRARIGSFGWCTGLLEDFALQRTAGVFCNSAYTEGLVKPRTRTIWRVDNPIRELFFSPPPGRSGSDKPRLLNVGVISPRKRQVELLETARLLHKRGLTFEMRFIGACDEATAYSRKFLGAIREATDAGYARYEGMKTDTELVEEMDAARALIHFPSEEAFGLVAAEGLARDLKFFGARLGGIQEIAAPVEDAALIDPEDWRGLSQVVEAWLRAGAPRSPFGRDSVRRFHPSFFIARKHLEIYQEVLAGKLS